jgi:hypothetical protein
VTWPAICGVTWPSRPPPPRRRSAAEQRVQRVGELFGVGVLQVVDLDAAAALDRDVDAADEVADLLERRARGQCDQRVGALVGDDAHLAALRGFGRRRRAGLAGHDRRRRGRARLIAPGWRFAPPPTTSTPKSSPSWSATTVASAYWSRISASSCLKVSTSIASRIERMRRMFAEESVRMIVLVGW